MRSSVLPWVFLMLAVAAQAEPQRLLGGTPEGLPGYSVDASGKLLVEAADKRRLLNCVTERLNVQIRFVALPTRRVLAQLASAEMDIAFPMGFNEERAARLQQSEATWNNPDVWVSLRSIDPQDRRLRVGARLGSPQHDDNSGRGYERLVGVYNYDDLPRLLSRNYADAVVVPQSVYEDMRPDWPVGVQVSLGQARSSGFYLPKGDPKGLAPALNEAIRRCRPAPRATP